MSDTQDYVELCATCGGPIDPESHAINAVTRVKYCSGRCWRPTEADA